MTVEELDAFCVQRGWLLIIGAIGLAVVRRSYTPDMYGKGLVYGFMGGAPQTLADKITEQCAIQASHAAVPDVVVGRGRG
ncbi:hypothetical protein [Nonomuraea longicatena]|uniref:Uncharacterized protein n=1 Tax=Nonomuraea longicatena TaxID=83682 RepID=A0ABP3ZAY6_9ACTN